MKLSVFCCSNKFIFNLIMIYVNNAYRLLTQLLVCFERNILLREIFFNAEKLYYLFKKLTNVQFLYTKFGTN